MDSYVVIVIIFGILILGILIWLNFFNKVLIARKKVISSRKEIYSEFGETREVTKAMIDFVKNNLEHEEDLLIRLNNTFDDIEDARRDQGNIKKLGKLDRTARVFLDLGDTYPKLKRNREYLKLKERILMNKAGILFAAESYRDEVMVYQKMDKGRVYNFLKKVFKFRDFEI